MRIAIGSDHAGFDLKEFVKGVLTEMGHEYEDFGCYSKDSVDYPDIAFIITKEISQKRFEQGILICGTGIGMSMVANRVRGVRAALCHETFSARVAREHNNANVLCLGGRVIGQGVAGDIVRTYLTSEFAGGRHVRRLEKIEDREC